MTTTHLPVLTLDSYDNPPPIVLMPPSDGSSVTTGASAAVSIANPKTSSPLTLHPPSEAEIRLLRLKNRSPKAPAHAHPIPSMQNAFNESLVEATRGPADKPKLRQYDAKTRRERLIAQEKNEEPHCLRWRYRPGQTQHELRKLMSQISFGMNLLLNGKANSDDQVVSIIQGHIDEIDEFLEVALEDFQQAATDLSGRIKYLRLPLDHLEVFEKLLEDRNYRAELIQNNEVIEHILNRTASMADQYENDFAEGLRSTQDFIAYLSEQRNSPRRSQYPDIDDIYNAMNGNTDGWQRAFKDLQHRASKLDELSTELSTMVAEMQKKAGEVSRRTWINIEPFSLPQVSSVRLSQQTSPASSPPPSVMSNRSPASSNSVGESITAAHAPMNSIQFNRLTITAQLGPALENPFDDLKYNTRRQDDAISEESSTHEEVVTTATDDYVYHEVNDDAKDKTIGDTDGGEGQDREEPNDGPREGDNEDDTYGSLYILQPRTYTPRLPAPLPSPAVKEYTPAETVEPLSPNSPNLRDSFSPRTTIRGSVEQQPASTPGLPKRSSLRQRVSLKANPPESIKIPPPHVMRSTPQLRESIRDQPTQPPLPPPDSAYGSDIDLRNRASAAIPEPSPPIFTHTMPSPLSDRQIYHPVQASPHSPLQQRPHTSYNAFPARQGTNSGYYPSHTRNVPSRAGGASMLSKVTTLTYDSSTTQGGKGEKRLKKKKSAFGWLKKAFSLSEEEKAAFEARRAAQDRNLYYENRSNKFLDGRRVRQPGQPDRRSPSNSTYQASTYQASVYPQSQYQNSNYPNSAYQHSMHHESTGYPSPTGYH